MLDHTQTKTFAPINAGFNRTFRPGRLSLGLVVPLESYAVGALPTMHGHLEAARLAEELGVLDGDTLELTDAPTTAVLSRMGQRAV